MDDMAIFLENCRQRDLLDYPPIDFEAIRAGRPQPAPPEVGQAIVEGAESDAGPSGQTPAPTAPATKRASPAARHGLGHSAVFTVRLARADLALLERRARLAGIAPSALARNLINIGLREGDGELAEAVRRVEDAAAQLRAALP